MTNWLRLWSPWPMSQPLKYARASTAMQPTVIALALRARMRSLLRCGREPGREPPQEGLDPRVGHESSHAGSDRERHRQPGQRLGVEPELGDEDRGEGAERDEHLEGGPQGRAPGPAQLRGLHRG